MKIMCLFFCEKRDCKVGNNLNGQTSQCAVAKAHCF